MMIQILNRLLNCSFGWVLAFIFYFSKDSSCDTQGGINKKSKTESMLKVKSKITSTNKHIYTLPKASEFHSR